MLRIHIRDTVTETATLSLEGRVIGPWVDELRHVCEGILTHGTRLVLDLSAVAFVGQEGIELFRALRDRQVVLRNCSPFVGAQLKG
jgi:anti-anti-sigma regulatory factor